MLSLSKAMGFACNMFCQETEAGAAFMGHLPRRPSMRDECAPRKPQAVLRMTNHIHLSRSISLCATYRECGASWSAWLTRQIRDAGCLTKAK